MKKSKNRIVFARGVALSDDKIILSGHFPDLDQKATRIATLEKGEWRHIADLPEIVSSLLVLNEHGEEQRVYALLRTGVLHSWRGQHHAVEIIDPTRALFFNEIRQIGGDLYACGAGRQVFRKRDQKWQSIDDGIFEKDPLVTFWALDGKSAGDLVAVGSFNSIYRFDGKNWSKQDFEPKLGIHTVRVIGDKVLACGAKGMVYEITGDQIRCIAQHPQKYPFFSLMEFGGTVYVGSEYDLWELKNQNLSLVKAAQGKNLGFFSLSTSERYLWCVGGEVIVRYDGSSWDEIKCPWNPAT